MHDHASKKTPQRAGQGTSSVPSRAPARIEDHRPAAASHTQLRYLAHNGDRATQFQRLQRVVTSPAQRTTAQAPSSSNAGDVVQRVVFIGASTRALPARTPMIAEVEAIARAYGPQRAARIVATFRAWLRDGPSRRYANARAVVDAILPTLGPDADAGSGSSSGPRSGESSEGRSAAGSETRSEAPSGSRTEPPDDVGTSLPPEPTLESRSEARTELPGDGGRDADRPISTSQTSQGAVPDVGQSGQSGTGGTGSDIHDRVERPRDVQPPSAVQPVSEGERLPAGSTAVTASERARPDLRTQIRPESLTRVGFEIELGRTYHFPESARPTLGQVLNRTLAEFVGTVPPAIRGGEPRRAVILEVLLDDIRTPDAGGCTAQVEFRTPPLRFSWLSTSLSAQIRRAISRFPTSMLTAASPVAVGQWRPTALLREHAAQLTEGAPDQRNFSISSTSNLAQHATISIELAAFGTLNHDQQNLLFRQGRGATDRQQLLDQLAALTNGSGSPLDATTVGRNRAGSTVKSPIESILAADPTLRAPRGASAEGSVTVGDSEAHPYAPLAEAVQQIRNDGQFPSVQGAGDRGYRAVAEKLQPPLRDTVSGQLRVLVEHRTGTLVSAVNEALRGRSEPLRPIMEAARDMDRNRVQRPRAPSTESSATSPTTSSVTTPVTGAVGTGGTRATVSASRSEPAGGGGARPVIAPPPLATMTVPQMVQHYGPGILWARGQGTFSHEFLQFRDHRAAALLRLTQNGLAPAEAAVISADLNTQFVQAGVPAQGDHPDAQLQEHIFDGVDVAWGRQLWALLRYFNGA
ncbi:MULTISPECIES: hypothetical protein [Pandoraea]|uniref:hypothetical protein n=1 Tax=Pandoraea TaxID=93217 RepID=UPI001F5E26D6|nr:MULTISPECIES: hypothetical protein [Pandoraea]